MVQSPVLVQPPVAPAVSQIPHALGVKTTKCLSILLLICGISMVIMQIIYTAVVEYDSKHFFSPQRAASGIWCGILIVISGILGCCAASKKTNTLVCMME